MPAPLEFMVVIRGKVTVAEDARRFNGDGWEAIDADAAVQHLTHDAVVQLEEPADDYEGVETFSINFEYAVDEQRCRICNDPVEMFTPESGEPYLMHQQDGVGWLECRVKNVATL